MNDPTRNVLRSLRHADPRLYTETRARELPDGEAGTLATLERMAAVAKKAAMSNTVRRVASTIIASQRNRDDYGNLLALDRFIRNTINFKTDTLGAEVLHDPLQLLNEIGVNGKTAADCDDVATLAASLARAMGYQPYFVICRKSLGGQWLHVHYAISIRNGPPIPFDPQERKKPGDWSAPPSLRKVVPA